MLYANIQALRWNKYIHLHKTWNQYSHDPWECSMRVKPILLTPSSACVRHTVNSRNRFLCASYFLLGQMQSSKLKRRDESQFELQIEIGSLTFKQKSLHFCQTEVFLVSYVHSDSVYHFNSLKWSYSLWFTDTGPIVLSERGLIPLTRVLV